MKLPNGERAFVNMAKLRDYSLSPTHEEGKHKAHVFQSALGMDNRHADWLRDQLLKAAVDEECTPARYDGHGQRYVIDFDVSFESRNARLRSAWIVRSNNDSPRLLSCYVINR
jgi:hypothetical protein